MHSGGGHCGSLDAFVVDGFIYTFTHAFTTVGPPKEFTGGTVPRKTSISTKQVLALGAWAKRELPMSKVRVLGSP